MDAEAIATRIHSALRDRGTPTRAAKERAYLKSDLVFLGTDVPAIRRVARTAYHDAGEFTREDLVAVVAALWARGVHECRMAAVELLKVGGELLGPPDLAWLEGLLRAARTWALVDGLAVSVVGAMVARSTAVGPTLDRWSADRDFWLRRAALLALLPGVRAGAPDYARISRYAEMMLDEREFFVRKAIGWVLREAGKRDPGFVATWLEPRTGRVSGVTIREAVKYLPAPQRTLLLESYRGRTADRPSSP